MNITFPPQHYHTRERNREFLVDLDKKTHYVTESWFETNMSRSSYKCYIDQYTDQKINPDEIEKVLGLINEETGLALTPINTNWGFSVGFQVLYLFDKMSLLIFLEKQLPEGYDFNKLSHVFNRQDNIEMLIACGLEKPKERWHYEY